MNGGVMDDSKKRAILYVDDEPANLESFVASFRRHYTIYTSTSAIEAVEILKEHKVSLILTDQRMPEMTGVQFLEAIIPEFPNPTRMILTGFSDIDAITKAINTGSVLRYLTKPWDERILKLAIDEGINIYEIEQSNKRLQLDLEEAIASQNKEIKLFEKYVPGKIIEHLLEQSSENTQSKNTLSNNEYRIISVLFSDIRSFTEFSESRDPKEVVTYLNQYFSIMADCVTKNQGTVYKFMGDGIIALFGAPVSSIYNQRNAAFCALDMLSALETFNETVGKAINYKTTIGIGINTGEAVVGHIVTEDFISYTVIGEAVEGAMQISDYTKSKPNSIIVSNNTFDRIKNDVASEESEEGQVGDERIKLYRIWANDAVSS